MFKINNSLSAYTLIELLLVISIIGFFLVAALNFYRQHQFQQQVSYIKNNADQLGQALNLYYYIKCADPDFPPAAALTIQDLQEAGVLPANVLKDISWVNYKMLIKSAYPKQGFRLIVQAVIDQPEYRVQYIRGQLNALYEAKGTISWSYLPSQKPAAVRDENWILGAGLGAFKKNMEETPAKNCFY